MQCCCCCSTQNSSRSDNEKKKRTRPINISPKGWREHTTTICVCVLYPTDIIIIKKNAVLLQSIFFLSNLMRDERETKRYKKKTTTRNLYRCTQIVRLQQWKGQKRSSQSGRQLAWLFHQHGRHTRYIYAGSHVIIISSHLKGPPCLPVRSTQ